MVFLLSLFFFCLICIKAPKFYASFEWILCAFARREMCARDKMNRHEQNKTAIIKYKLCILCLSTLHIRCDLSCLHIPRTLPWPPPRLEGCGRDELADQKKIFKATVWEPCSFQLIWAALLFSCILPALMLTGLWAIGDYIMESTHKAFWVLCRDTNDSRIRCVWSPGSISRWLWWLKRVCEGHIYVWIHTMVAPLPESSYMAWFPSSLSSNKSLTWTTNDFSINNCVFLIPEGQIFF